MSTKEFARKLGLLKRRSASIHEASSNPTIKFPRKDQIFSYLIVLDFESTCWKDKKNSFWPEIIEFPAVLLNLSNGEIEDTFQCYVQPTEHPRLSTFCTELTGISQEKVNDGIPIGPCIKLFKDWINGLVTSKEIVFPTQCNILKNRCVFATWSDWDLNVCLRYECKRKQINYPSYLKSWIDLRHTYRMFYKRSPKGLNGALEDVGMNFIGREHSGIDDAVNTAKLTWRMVVDGCVMKATKSLVLNLNVINEEVSAAEGVV